MSTTSIEKDPLYGPFIQYRLLSLTENLAMHAQYEKLIEKVAETEAYFDEAENWIKDEELKTEKEKQFENLFDTDPIPHAHEPAKIRYHFANAFREEEESVANEVNWLLRVNERGPLSQDIDGPGISLTRRVLQSKRCDWGKLYDNYVNDALEILKRLRKFLDKPDKILSNRMMSDVEELKFYTFAQVTKFIDKLSFRVLSDENAYMNDLCPRTRDYYFKGRRFDVHIWAFKNVPLNLTPYTMAKYIVQLREIGVDVVVPFSAISSNMVVRGLHYHFDNLSFYARFYEMPRVDVRELNLCKALTRELEGLTKLQEEVQQMLIKQWEEYEEALQAEEEEEKRKAKELMLKGGGGSRLDIRKQEPKKTDASPPEAKKHEATKSEGSTPKEKPGAKKRRMKSKRKLKKGKKTKGSAKDPWKKYADEPQEITSDDYPDVLEDYIAREDQKFKDYMLTFHPSVNNPSKGELNQRKYQILGGIYHLHFIAKPHALSTPTLIMTWYDPGRATKRLDIHAELGPNEQNVSKFFKIIITLPEIFCYWGQPIPCLFHRGVHHIFREYEARGSSIHTQIPIIINDYNLHELFTVSRMSTFVKTIIPRLIESFHLPADLNEDTEAPKPQTMHHLTLKEKSLADEIEERKKHLSFDDQNWPERLFPIFEEVLPVIIIPRELSDSDKKPTNMGDPYQYFSELLEAVQGIKDQYGRTQFVDEFGEPVIINCYEYEQVIKEVTHDEMQHKKKVKGLHRLTKKASVSRSWKRGKPLRPTRTTSLFRRSSRERQSKIKFEPEVVEKTAEVVEKNEVLKVDPKPEKEEIDQTPTKWSTANILKSEFDAKERKLTIWTDRLGTFGLAFYRYMHFPFQNWYTSPSETNPDQVELVVQSMFAVFRFTVSSKGYTVSVTDFSKTVKNRKIYFQIKEPIADFQQLKKQMQDNYVNLFPERDFSLYITGYFSEKHMATEFHTYSCISLYATSLKFYASVWNKLSSRRILVLQFCEKEGVDNELCLIRITPEDALFVEIEELCSPDLDSMNLEYTPTWQNAEWYPDMNHMIISTYTAADEMRLKDPYTLLNMRTLLQGIRPLSCS